MLNVLLFTNLFPNPEQPLRGNFVESLLLAMRNKANITVISPLPWSPSVLMPDKIKQSESEWAVFSKIPYTAEWKGFEVYYPKYPFIPVVSRPIHAMLMAAAVYGLVKKVAEDNEIDIINVHWAYPDAIAAVWIGRQLGIPVVVTAHGSDVNIYGSYKLRRPQMKWAFNNSERTVTVSHALLERVADGMGVNRNKLAIIPNGVDIDRFYPISQDIARKQLKLKSDERYLLFVGRFHEVKGLEYLFKAMAILKERGALCFQTILIGDGPLKFELADAVEAMSITEHVIFKGAKPNSELPLWMNACDVFCLPSKWEGQPCVILEALACGRPVVASSVGGIPELIDESNGLLVEPRNSKALADALEKSFKMSWNDKLISGMMQNFSWSSAADAYLDLFSKAVNDAKAT